MVYFEMESERVSHCKHLIFDPVEIHAANFNCCIVKLFIRMQKGAIASATLLTEVKGGGERLYGMRKFVCVSLCTWILSGFRVIYIHFLIGISEVR